MNRRFVSIWFRHLKTDWHTRRDPSLKDKTLVVSEMVHGRMVVTAVNPAAQSKGIFAGTVVADARAIFKDIKVIDDKPGLEQKLLKNLSIWCIRFTPVVSIDLPDGLILDATGCAHLWGGETAYINDITKKLKNFGYHVNAAISDTIGCSWAMSRFCKGNTIIKKGDHMNALMQMPSESLRFDSGTIERLHKLGLRHVKDFIGMPRQSLRRRFGELFLKRLDQALGYEDELIQAERPVEPYEERLPCLEPIITLAGIEVALQSLLDTLCTRLLQDGKGIRQATLNMFTTDGKCQHVSITTSHPSANNQHLFKLFEIHFTSINPEMGIEVFLLEAKKVEKISAVQEKLFSSSSVIANKDLAEWLDRLTAKFGEGHIKRFLPDEHYWPERSYKSTASLDEAATSEWNATKPRPLILLEKPEAIEVTAPIPDYPPMNFRHKGVLHKVAKADGPERIEQEWWIEEGQHRDYYYVEDEDGKRYWLYRSGHYDEHKTYGWYLHGYFA